MKPILLYTAINFDSCLESNKVCIRQCVCFFPVFKYRHILSQPSLLSPSLDVSPPNLGFARGIASVTVPSSRVSSLSSSHGSLPVPVAVSVSQLPLPTLTSSSLLQLHAHLRSLRVSPDFPAPDGITGSHALLSHHGLIFPVCLFSYCPSTCCLNSFKL